MPLPNREFFEARLPSSFILESTASYVRYYQVNAVGVGNVPQGEGNNSGTPVIDVQLAFGPYDDEPDVVLAVFSRSRPTRSLALLPLISSSGPARLS